MTTQIGSSIQIKGTLTAEEPVTIAGRVEGAVTVTGHVLTVSPDGYVDAEAVADTIVIDGTATGRLSGTERILVHQTATVTGEISAPVVAVTEGATIHGRIDVGPRQRAMPRADNAPARPASAA